MTEKPTYIPRESVLARSYIDPGDSFLAHSELVDPHELPTHLNLNLTDRITITKTGYAVTRRRDPITRPPDPATHIELRLFVETLEPLTRQQLKNLHQTLGAPKDSYITTVEPKIALLTLTTTHTELTEYWPTLRTNLIKLTQKENQIYLHEHRITYQDADGNHTKETLTIETPNTNTALKKVRTLHTQLAQHPKLQHIDTRQRQHTTINDPIPNHLYYTITIDHHNATPIPTTLLPPWSPNTNNPTPPQVHSYQQPPQP